MPPAYRGRFAPSPTGSLHFGSLVAAVASFADARAHAGEWLLRMEDIDGPRTVAGAAADIQRTLEIHGFEWNGAVVYQTEREPLYRAALTQLQERSLVYPCGCSRKDVPDDGVYAGTCRHGLQGRTARSWRLRVEGTVRFEDRVQGLQEQDLATQTGDFVLLRADGAWAYQLAVVVDDAAQGVTHIVRGADLLGSTARQIYLQTALELPTPDYLHIPVAVDWNGEKLSKQTGAPPLDSAAPAIALSRASAFLGHPLPKELAGCGVSEFWAWLAAQWRPTRIPVEERVQTF